MYSTHYSVCSPLLHVLNKLTMLSSRLDAWLLPLLSPSLTEACDFQRFDIDVKKMPLGNLSKTQVQKGYDVLEELRTAIASHNSSEVATLTSRFYTVIPHNFGRSRPPLIDTVRTANIAEFCTTGWCPACSSCIRTVRFPGPHSGVLQHLS